MRCVLFWLLPSFSRVCISLVFLLVCWFLCCVKFCWCVGMSVQNTPIGTITYERGSHVMNTPSKTQTSEVRTCLLHLLGAYVPHDLGTCAISRLRCSFLESLDVHTTLAIAHCVSQDRYILSGFTLNLNLEL